MGDKDNFVSCYRALSYVGNILLPYTKDRFNTLHQSIYGQLAALPNCTERCSEQHGRETNRWCQTCSQWKDAIQSNYRKGNPTRWQNLRSWTWPTTRESIAKVFVPCGHATDYNLRDISTACFIWKHCKSFNINRVVSERVSDLRNDLYGHNPDMKVSDLDKSRLFDALKDLVKDADVQGYIDRGKCLNDLTEIENGDDLEKYKAVIEQLEDKLEDKFEEVMKKIDAMEASRDNSNHLNTFIARITPWKAFGASCVVLSLAIIIMVIQQNIGVVRDKFLTNRYQWTGMHSQTDCVSEAFAYPFPQDLPLFPYISNHQPLMGREWLFQKLTISIYHSNKNSHGVLVIAEMGYGKSALVSHILCVKESLKGWDIKQNIVAFHICKFDVPSTTRVGRFIRRLIGFFATHSAAFGSHISFLDKHSLIYDEDKCGKEPIACLDQGVLLPLARVTAEGRTWIVVIDALDECFDSDTDTNHILALLKKRIKKFPQWVKFIIFSRHIKSLDLKAMEVLQLRSNDGHNLNDIEIYLDYHKTILEQVKELFGTKSDSEVLKQILQESEGNFLFITFAIEYIMNRYLDNRRLHLPRNLTDIYESNFERQFHTAEDFQYAKLILQIVCASIGPMVKSDIRETLHVNNYTNTIMIEQSFDKLSFCLRIEKQVTFIHKSIHDWLTSPNNNNYKIFIEHGHALLSKHLIEKAKRNQSMDFIEMAIHVGQSDTTELREIFQSLNHEHIEPKVLHRLINLTDSGGALQLVLPYVTDVDPLDGQGQTPAFVAAAKGHLKQLKLFVKTGAEISLIIQPQSLYQQQISTLESAFDYIENTKTVYFSGYTLLHIAVTNNRLDVVQYILKINSTLMYAGNDVGHLPSDIACRYGFQEILQEIASLDSSIIGQECIYLAAKYGHGQVVDFVRTQNVHGECVSEDASYKAYTSVVDTNSNTFIKPLDVWWVVFKESPLHVAVRNGHYAVVETLVTYYSHLLDCVDAFGRTPFLTSIWYNQVGIFTFLSFRANETSEVCSHPYHDLFQLTLSKEITEAKNCLNGFSIAHLFARFDRGEMIDYARQNALNIDWLLLDDEGYPAEHYAACFGSITYLTALRDGYIPAYSTDTRRYKHGMTIYHSAALCGRNESLRLFTRGIWGRTIPQFVDDRGRGVMFYTFMENTNSVNLYKCTKIVFLLLKSGHSLVQLDLDGRNILHYALLNGVSDYGLIMNIYSYSKSIWFTLIEQRDVTGKTPVEFSLSRHVGSQNTYFKHPKQCAFYAIYYTGCEKETKEELMYPWEMAIYQTFLMFYTKQSGHTVDPLFLSQIYTNYPYLTTAVLVYLNNTESDLRRNLLRTMRFELPPNNLFYYSLVAITNLKPRVLVVCNQHFHRSPLHKLAYTKLPYGYMIIVFEHVQKSKLDWGCPDKTGLNSFHYAILGSNILTSNYLMQHRITMTTKAVRHKDIIWMTLFPWKLSSEMSIPIFDRFLADFLSMHVGLFKHTDFCTNGTKGLSVVHLLCFNGMVDTLRVIKSKFGPGVMSCTTKDGFTPYFVWKLYNRLLLFSDSDVFDKSVQIVHTPRIEAEIYLLYKLRGVSLIFYRKSLESFQCRIEVLHLKFDNIRKKYRLLKCIEAYINWKWLVPEIHRPRLHAFQTEINLIQMKPFLEIATQLDTLLLQKDSNCLAINNFLTVDMRQILYSLDRAGIFSAGTSKMLLRYLMNVISRGDIECPLSEHASNRLTVILDATNNLVSKLVPWLRRTSTMYVLTIQHLYPSSKFRKERSMHLLNRIGSEVRIHKSNRESGVDFAAVYKDFRYLDIIENTLYYRTWPEFIRTLD